MSHHARWSIECGTLAQESVMRALRSCNVCGGIAYTYRFRYPHREMSSGFRSDESGDYSSKPPYLISWQHDGAPAHKTSSVKHYLIKEFKNLTIRYGGFEN
ncbi:hypothetical protein TNCV_4032801 [Trichonephila clavipes]|nr:hypothetical protein TNCV_4032801 [Trichonephila clavipes]